MYMLLLLLAACQGNTDAPVDTAAADADTDTDTDSDTDTDTDADTDTDTDIRDLTPVPLGDCVGDLGTFDTLLPSWSRALAELDGAPARVLVGDGYLVVIGGSTVAVYDYAPSALLDTDVTLRWSAPLGATVVDVAIETTFERVATIDADNQIQLFALADGAVGPTHDGSADPAYTTVTGMGGGVQVAGGDLIAWWAPDADEWTPYAAAMPDVQRMIWTGMQYVAGVDADEHVTVALYSPYLPEEPLATWVDPSGDAVGDILAHGDRVLITFHGANDDGTNGIVTLDADDLTVVESSLLSGFGPGQLDGNAASPAAFLVDDTFLGAFPWDGSAGSAAELPGGVDVAVAPDDTFLFTVSDDGALQRWGCWAE